MTSPLFFSKQAEQGFETLRNDLSSLASKDGNGKRVISLLRVALVCIVAGACLAFGAWIVLHVAGWF